MGAVQGLLRHKPVVEHLLVFLPPYDYACLYVAAPELLRGGAPTPLAVVQRRVLAFLQRELSERAMRVVWSALLDRRASVTGDPVLSSMGTVRRCPDSVVHLQLSLFCTAERSLLEALPRTGRWWVSRSLGCARRKARYPLWLHDELYARKR